MSGHVLAGVSVGDSFQKTLDSIFAFLPNLLAFIVILIIGYIVAKIIKKIIAKALQKVGLDKQLHDSPAKTYVDKVSPNASPSNAIAQVVFLLIFAFFLFSAIGALKIPALTVFMNQVLAYLPNIIVAILIFVIAAILAGAAAAAVVRFMGDTPTGKVAAAVVPALVMVIALFMILDQLKIAPQIVTIAFAATMGALALGLALAFGLGGRPIAQQMLQDAYDAGRRNKDQIKQDMQTGKDRAKADAAHAKQHLQDDAAPSSSSTDTPPSG